MESSLFSITYSIFGMLDFCNKNQRDKKKRERERREKKRKSYLRGFLFCAVMA
jgi:hypothetical protein